MELLVRNAEGNVPLRDREYAAKKLGKLERFFHKATKVEMVHHEQKGEHRLEVTVFADEFKIRSEEHDKSLQACIDRVSEKLEHRLRKLKHKLVNSHRKRGVTSLPEALAEAQESENDQPDHHIIYKKTFPAKPMSTEEAVLQMELLGHTFFAFQNQESGKFGVLYVRKDGHYGLLEPDL